MSLTTEQYEKIIRFLDAEMDAAEMDAFEKELVSAPEMRKQLEFEQTLRDEFALQNIKDLPGTVVTKEPVSIKTNAKKGRLTVMQKWLAIGAAIITVVLFISVFWQKPEKKTPVANTKQVDIAPQKNYQPKDIVKSPLNDTSAAIDLAIVFKQYFKKDEIPETYPIFLAEALMDYESGKYSTLQKLDLNSLPQTRGSGEMNSKEKILTIGHYFKGLAFLQTNHTKEAIINLHWVINNKPDKVLRAKAQWYLTLAYLKDNNSEKAAALCTDIIKNKDNDVLVKEAEKILEIIKK